MNISRIFSGPDSLRSRSAPRAAARISGTCSCSLIARTWSGLRSHNSPLTKSLRSDSVPSESEREFGCGDGSAGGSSGRPKGDVVRDAAFSGSRVLRPPARGAGRSRVRRLRGGDLPSVLRPDHGRTLSAAGPVLSDAHGRAFRGDRQRARDRVAVLGFVFSQGVPPPGEPPAGSGPFLDVEVLDVEDAG